MRIVIEARESGTSTGRHIDKLIENLHKLSPSEEIIIRTKPHRLDFFKEIAPSFKTVISDYKEFSLSEQLGLALDLYKERADLVHFTMTQQPILYFKRSITTIHDLTTARFDNPTKNNLIFKLKQFIYRGVVVWVCHKSKAILTISEFVKKDLANFSKVNPQKITVTYLAADKIPDKPEAVEKLAGKKFLMYVGRPLPHKNLERLIEAFAVLKRSHPELVLALVGQDHPLYDKAKKIAQEKGIKDVIFTGFVSEGQLRWLYENTAAYVFPSLSEGFGLPALEAMMHGAPVVSSHATCLPEIYGDAAHYFDPYDVGDMEVKIHEVLSDKNLRDKLIKNGYAQAKKYSWLKMARQTLALYRKILSG